MLNKSDIDFLANFSNWNIGIEHDPKTSLTKVSFSIDIDLTYDFGFELSVEDFRDLTREIFNRYEAFDPDEETALWLGPDGHGRNGAPYHIQDILDEMNQIDEELRQLAVACLDRRNEIG